MSVIPLFAPRDLSFDWSQQELSELYRVEDTLVQAGISVETERGLTEEGDPWFVFCRHETGDVIIHFARCDGLYLAVGSFFEGVLRGDSFSAIVRQFLDNQPLMLTRRRDNNDTKLFMHPTVLLMALVTTAFLVSQDSDPVYSDSPVGKEDMLKGDSLLMRVAQAVRSTFSDAKVNEYTGSVSNIAPAALLSALLIVKDSQSVGQADSEDQGNNASLELSNLALSDDQASPVSDEQLALLSARDDDNLNSDSIEFSITAPSFTDTAELTASLQTKTVAISQTIELADNSAIYLLSSAEEATIATALSVGYSAGEPDVSALDGANDIVVSADLPFTPEGAYKVIIAYSVSYSENPTNTYDSTAYREFNEISAELNIYLSDPVDVNYATIENDEFIGFAFDAAVEAAPTAASFVEPAELANSYDAIADDFVKQFIASATDLQVLLFGSSLILVDNDQVSNSSEYLSLYSWDFQDGSSISIIGIVPDELSQLIA